MSYKSIVRRVRRLPLVSVQLRSLQNISKSLYSSSKSKNFVKLLDNILVREKFDDITHILDLLYQESTPKWLKDFKNINYLSLKRAWPQVHLINELTKDKEILKKYHLRLDEEQNDDISMMTHFGLNPGKETILPFSKYSTNIDKTVDIMQEVTKRYQFLLDNQRILTRTKFPILEVTYATDRLAQPLHPAKRDRLLKEKVATVKSILETYKPITIAGLQEIHQLAIYKPSQNDVLAINKNFFKYMEKKRQTEVVSSMVQKHLRAKKLIPSDHNIRKIFRSYTMRQFYIEDDKYKTSWMQNFYENENSMLNEIDEEYSSTH